MQITARINPESLMSLESYSKWRKLHQAEIIALRRLRSVHLGEHLNLQFESEATIRYQIQEMLRVEKIFDEDGIQQEIDVYAPLIPTGQNWTGTLLIEYCDEVQRHQALAHLIGVEDHLFVEVTGRPRVYAIADEDLPRENEAKTSAVHFVRFELGAATCGALKAGAGVTLGCDHASYPAQCQVAPATLAALVGDLVTA